MNIKLTEEIALALMIALLVGGTLIANFIVFGIIIPQ
jgi:hypothetical protein